MSTLEMKGEILDLVSTIRTEAGLENLLQLIREFVVKEVGGPENLDEEQDMTPAQIAALRRAIERSENGENFISNSDEQSELKT